MEKEIKRAKRQTGDTATQILDVAERLVQVRGFNAFSYADIASELEITTAALHYHFPGKAELGDALIARYSARFFEALTSLESEVEDAPDRLEAYAHLYGDVLRNKRMCLCGMLAAEYETLPPPMQKTVVRFFADNEQWLARVLEQGRDVGTLQFEGTPSDVARMIVSGLEGALLVARPFRDIARFEAVSRQLLGRLKPESSSTSKAAEPRAQDERQARVT